MSAVRKTADLGRPMGGPKTLSTTAMLRSNSFIQCITDMMPATPMRLATKLGVSLAWTMPLPSTFSPKSAIWA